MRQSEIGAISITKSTPSLNKVIEAPLIIERSNID